MQVFKQIFFFFFFFFFFFSSRRRHTRCREVSWARRCVQETGINAEYMGEKFEARRTLRRSLLVYPEGHRNLKDEPLPLKFGMIRYAYERKRKVQILIAFGLEDSINERAMTINTKGSLIKYWFDSPIFPEEYPTLEEFDAVIRQRFAASFKHTLKLSQQYQLLLFFGLLHFLSLIHI
eukprot:TRINITY_DN5703_c0_g1_i3.p2 TRINITY_DN5703_c0_g1~~TRINITY_DN5703_c0_g1_i3.p2  ORF type:complete len:178 (-),score=62.34 TRINITY_DN5703_c0_g1_i3:154-687(-)